MLPKSHSVNPPPPPPLSAGELILQPNFQKRGGLTGPQLLEGGYWERGR